MGKTVMNNVTNTRTITWKRLVSWAMTPIILLAACPQAAVLAQTLTPPSPPPSMLLKETNTVPVHVRTGPHELVKIVPTLTFSKNPTDLEISTARVFLEPLAAMTGQPVAGE